MFKGNIKNNVRKLNKIVIILCVSGENKGKLGEKILLYHKWGGNTLIFKDILLLILALNIGSKYLGIG